MIRTLFAILLSVLLSGCTETITDIFKSTVNYVVLRTQTAIVLEKNSTTEGQSACTDSNQIVVRKSVPEGDRLFCRDASSIWEELTPGQSVCPGGVTIGNFEPSGQVMDCNQITLCGVTPTINVVGERTDGGTIDELTFENLPWGCDARLEYSPDPNFNEENVDRLEFYIQPPDCPFCPRTNEASCEPCRDLDDDETIVTGQVIKCPEGQTCDSCPVMNSTGEPEVPHGMGKIYYRRQKGVCPSNKCSANAKVRVCNNGNWEGDDDSEGYVFPQCEDPNCGCRLPNDPTEYAHNASKPLYKTDQAPCGTDCSTLALNMKCFDGEWVTPAGEPIAQSEILAHPKASCKKSECHCDRPGRKRVEDGRSEPVYSKSLVSCTESCNQFRGTVSCDAGKLTATDPGFLNYISDSCAQEDCGCKLRIANGETLDLPDGGERDLFKFPENTAQNPDACTDPSNKVKVTCTDKVPSEYDALTFRYASCDHKALPCNFNDGSGQPTTLASGRTMTISKSSRPACGVACDTMVLKCENQVLKKRVGALWENVTQSEINQYPDPNACVPNNCQCTINGHVIPMNQSRSDFYKIDEVKDCNLNGCTENKATITCTPDGPTSSKGDDPYDYAFRACKVIRCPCKVPWGGTIEDGKKFKAFKIKNASCGDKEACTKPASFKDLTCSNGNLTPSYDDAVFQHPACAPAVCECTLGDITAPFGSKVTAYAAEIAPPGESCSSYQAELLCEEPGIWSGADPKDYPYSECEDLSDAGDGGGTGDGTGNDEGPGVGIKARVGLGDKGDGDGGPCLNIDSCFRNSIGVALPTINKKSCLLPWGGGEIEFYGSITAFDTQCVSGSDTCARHSITRMCHFPKWSGSDAYRFPSCEKKAVCP